MDHAIGDDEAFDVIVAGSGAAGLAAALTAAAGGLSVLVAEKSERVGGTSAMSGAGTWIPANRHAREAGLADSSDEALEYLQAVLPEAWWREDEARLRAFVETAPEALNFIERTTPLHFELTREPDPIAEAPGGKAEGRMVSPRVLRRGVVGPFGRCLRRSTLPHVFTYRELIESGLGHAPLRTLARHAPMILRRKVLGEVGQGAALIVGLLKGCLDQGCRIALEARVVRLARDGTGGIHGATVEQRGAARNVQARRGVVLATGGFEWDNALLVLHFRGPLDRIGSPRTNTGDGQRLAAEVGAALDRMDQANVYPTLPVRYEGRPHGIPATFQADPHAIVVDRHGRRFASEYDYNIGEALDRRDAGGSPAHLPCWVIGGREYLAHAPMVRWHARRWPGWIVRARTVHALAREVNVPSGALAETVERYNGFCANGRDEDFRRGEPAWERFKAGLADGGPNRTLVPLRPPFAAIPFNRSILGTKGGPRTNANAQVLRADGTVIPGLYAAGIVAASPFGTRAVGAGTTIGPCLTWGYIAGLALRRDNR
jgi:3-oxosteroid 1-dehydrogenase